MTQSITVAQLDALIAEISLKEMEKEVIEASLTDKNKEIALLESQATEILQQLEREKYDSPHGSIELKEEIQVKNPPDDRKHLLWDWMREKGIYDRYAQVHASSLKSLYKAELAIAMENGEGDPLTFALPGMDPATIFWKLKFKPKKK